MVDISHRYELDEFHLIWGIDTKTTLWYNTSVPRERKGNEENESCCYLYYP